jgi:uncharacterized protein (DUF1800 family)
MSTRAESWIAHRAADRFIHRTAPSSRLGRGALAAVFTALLTTLFAALPAPRAGGAAAPERRLPWREAGLTERQAAAHLLDRFAFGPRGPREIDEVVALGLEVWLDRQLAADLPEADLERRLAELPGLDLSSREIVETYPSRGMLLARARREGVLGEEMMARLGEALEARGRGTEGGRGEGMEGLDAASAAELAEVRRRLRELARERGYRRQRELYETLVSQKLLRAVESPNQLREVLTDFWYNHFNVSLTDGEARFFVLPYERDVLRPRALGRFRDLLGATARHPAMLLYLDNARSVAPEGAVTTLDRRRGARPRRLGGTGAGLPDRPRGLNENYARELLELHTLGVDGGYTQKDVLEVARAFSGWTVAPPPMLDRLDRFEGRRLERLRRAGFVLDGLFLFRAGGHDAGTKTVLGTRLPAGRGIEDGEEVLDLLARHPATAHHLAGKLAVRLVSDTPPPALVDRLAGVFTFSGGDLRRVILELAYSPEFWSPEARQAKIKSPFELAVSSLRALGAQVDDPRPVVRWIGRMGQNLYAYPAPTGYPDQAAAWVNTGSLLNRMNFGLELAAGRTGGVRFDLAQLAGGREPESRQDALATYAALLLPERDLEGTRRLLAPLLDEPELAARVRPTPRRGGPSPRPSPVEQVVGLILGSPEFQRR